MYYSMTIYLYVCMYFCKQNEPGEHGVWMSLLNLSDSFAEVGKRMGELWHTLTEDEKEDYRFRAREIAEKNLKEWHIKMKKFPQQVTNAVTKVMAQVTFTILTELGLMAEFSSQIIGCQYEASTTSHVRKAVRSTRSSTLDNFQSKLGRFGKKNFFMPFVYYISIYIISCLFVYYILILPYLT